MSIPLRDSPPHDRLAHAPTIVDRERGRAPPDAERIGRFEVEAVLGAGGSGVVFSARDPELDRHVAIKLVHGGAPNDEDDVRLLREARTLARLRHPNVLTVHEAGQHAGHVFMATEKVDGGTLRDELERRRARGDDAWSDVVALFVDAGRGLASAHAIGLVHRDFKPDNVLVSHDGRVLVADFGLVGATPRASLADAIGLSVTEPLTLADVVMGTPAYMAPEQHYATEVDARADQFAFCVSLWEALFGELPVDGKTRETYVRNIERRALRAPTRPVPAWLRTALAKGMSPDAEDRFESMEALLQRIDVSLPSERRGRRFVMATLTLVILAPALIVWPVGDRGPLSHETMIVFDGVSTALFLIFFLIGRQYWRGWVDARVLALVVFGAGANVLMGVGAAMAGIDAAQTELLHPLLWGVITGCAAICYDWRILPAAGLYLGAFLVGAGVDWRPYWMVGVLHSALLLNLALVYPSVVDRAARLMPPRRRR